MAEDNPKQASLAHPAQSQDSRILGTPKNQSKLGGIDPNSSLRRSTGGNDDSPKIEESADAKRYEQLTKICQQMREKEAEINHKEDTLNSLHAKRQNLEQTLAELREKRSKTAPSEKSEGTRQIEQSMSDKNTLIQVIENELTELSVDQKARVSSDEAIISGYIKKITNIESQIGKNAKQSALATNKLLELQTKALNDVPANEQNQQLKTLNELLQKRKAELTVAKDTQIELQSNLATRNKGSTADSSESIRIKAQIQQLESNLIRVKDTKVINEKVKKVEEIKQATEAEFKKKLHALNQNITTSEVTGPSKKTEDQKKKLADLQNELDQLKASEHEDNQTITKNIQQIQKKKDQKKKHQDLKKTQEQQQQTKIKELNKQIQSLRKEQKKLKQQESELLKSHHNQDLEAAKKKVSKRQGDIEGIENLRVAKAKLDKEVHEAKDRFFALEKEQKSHVPSNLIEQNRTKVEGKKSELKIFETLTSEIAAIKKQINELLIEKDKIQWERNPRIDDFDREIKAGKLRIDDVTQQNKDMTKRLAQETSKLTEYIKTYPDFQIPKKGKKGGLEQKDSKKEDPKSEKKDNSKTHPAESKNPKAQPKTQTKNQSAKKSDSKQGQNPKSGKKNKRVEQVEAEPIQIQIVQEIYIIEEQDVEPEQKLEQKPTKKSNKKGAKAEPKHIQEVIQGSSPALSEKLAEIERKIIQEATKQINEEQDAVNPTNKKAAKKDNKKKSKASSKESAKHSAITRQTEDKFTSQSSTAKQEVIQGGLKNFLLPGAVFLIIGLIMLALK